jgi:hypothetical protein
MVGAKTLAHLLEKARATMEKVRGRLSPMDLIVRGDLSLAHWLLH